MVVYFLNSSGSETSMLTFLLKINILLTGDVFSRWGLNNNL